MKVLYLTAFYPEIGGPFTALKTLLPVLIKRGIKIKVLSTIPSNYPKEKLQFIHNLPFEVLYVKETLPHHIFSSFSIALLKELREEKNIDLINLDGIFNFYSILCSMNDKPYILSNRGALMIEAYKMKKFKKIKKRIFLNVFGEKIIKKAKIIHLLTEEEKKHFLYFFPYAEEKIRVIPNGIDLKYFKNLPSKEDFFKRFPHLKGKKVILFLSRINWKKGLDLLIPAFAEISKVHRDIHLLIAGKDDGDGYEKRVKKWIEQYRLEKHVTFTGFVTGRKKLCILANSDVFVLPSYSENFGIAVIEAMACGLPVVITDKVGVHQEIRENEAGIIVSPEIQEVYVALKELLENKFLAEKISKNAKIMVKKYYGIEKVADKMIKLYEYALRH